MTYPAPSSNALHGEQYVAHHAPCVWYHVCSVMRHVHSAICRMCKAIRYVCGTMCRAMCHMCGPNVTVECVVPCVVRVLYMSCVWCHVPSVLSDAIVSWVACYVCKPYLLSNAVISISGHEAEGAVHRLMRSVSSR